MKLVASTKAQAPSKPFAQPQAAQTPSCDTWVLLQSANSQYANSSTEGKRFPAGLGSKAWSQYQWWMCQGRTPKNMAMHNTVPLAILAS